MAFINWARVTARFQDAEGKQGTASWNLLAPSMVTLAQLDARAAADAAQIAAVSDCANLGYEVTLSHVNAAPEAGSPLTAQNPDHVGIEDKLALTWGGLARRQTTRLEIPGPVPTDFLDDDQTVNVLDAQIADLISRWTAAADINGFQIVDAAGQPFSALEAGVYRATKPKRRLVHGRGQEMGG